MNTSLAHDRKRVAMIYRRLNEKRFSLVSLFKAFIISAVITAFVYHTYLFGLYRPMAGLHYAVRVNLVAIFAPYHTISRMVEIVKHWASYAVPRGHV